MIRTWVVVIVTRFGAILVNYFVGSLFALPTEYINTVPIATLVTIADVNGDRKQGEVIVHSVVWNGLV